MTWAINKLFIAQDDNSRTTNLDIFFVQLDFVSEILVKTVGAEERVDALSVTRKGERKKRYTLSIGVKVG